MHPNQHSPQPGAQYSPQPGAQYSPQPGAQYSPQPGAQYSPQPGQPMYPPGQPMYPPGQPMYPPGQPMYPPGYMPMVGASEHVPPGLEYLSVLDQMLIKQEVHILEAIVDWECSNKYKMFNNMGQQCYFALEESNCCCRQGCGTRRSFTMHITDNMGQDIFTVERPFKCCGGNFSWCAVCSPCQDEVRIWGRDGTLFGTVKESFSLWKPHYTIYDKSDREKYEIWGPCCTFSCCRSDVRFRITTLSDGQEIGQIRKMWSGILREGFTDADNFGVNFPVDMDVKMKAVLIGCVFLIDFMFFETDEKGQGAGAIGGGAALMQ